MTTNIPISLTGTNSTIDTNGLGATFSGVLSGGGALTKAGAGTLVLSGVNAYGGGTTITGGLFRRPTPAPSGPARSRSTAVGSSPAPGLAFGNGLTLDAGAANTIGTQAFSLNLSGAVSGAGGFAKEGSGTLTLSGSSSYRGAYVNAGTLLGGAPTPLRYRAPSRSPPARHSISAASIRRSARSQGLASSPTAGRALRC